MTIRTWILLSGLACVGMGRSATAQEPLVGCGPRFRQCGIVCQGTPSCHEPCQACACDNDGCGVIETTCHDWTGGECVGLPIGYGGFGDRKMNDYCVGTLVPMNVDPTPPYYPAAPEGMFSCWFNSPDVLCPTAPPILNYVNVRQCYTAPDGHTTDYGCGDCPSAP